MANRPPGHVPGCGCPICGRIDEGEHLREEPPITEEEESEAQPRWQGREASAGEPIYVDVGRGQTVPVPPGSPFVPTMEHLADEAHYGGMYRVFLNGSEVINPEDSPATVEPGMRLAITSYDKVGI